MSHRPVYRYLDVIDKRTLVKDLESEMDHEKAELYKTKVVLIETPSDLCLHTVVQANFSRYVTKLK